MLRIMWARVSSPTLTLHALWLVPRRARPRRRDGVRRLCGLSRLTGVVCTRTQTDDDDDAPEPIHAREFSAVHQSRRPRWLRPARLDVRPDYPLRINTQCSPYPWPGRPDLGAISGSNTAPRGFTPSSFARPLESSRKQRGEIPVPSLSTRSSAKRDNKATRANQAWRKSVETAVDVDERRAAIAARLRCGGTARRLLGRSGLTVGSGNALGPGR